MEITTYFDGQTNRRRIVELRFGTTLDMWEGDTRIACWPYADIRLSDTPPNALRLSCVSAPPLARLETLDPILGSRLQTACPNLKGPGSTASISVRRIAAWSLAAVASIAGLIWFGMPFVAEQAGNRLPASWERPMGQAVDKQIRAMFSDTECTAPAGRAALSTVTRHLQDAARLPIPPDPIVLRSPVPNAFAAPGGRIYVLSGLLNRAESPDELAGILAHEFGHVAHRDGIKRLIRDGGTGFLAGLLFGDISGAGAIMVAARTLLSAAYSREIEADADGFAIDLMHRIGRPTAPMGDLLQRMSGPADEDLSLLHDHPLTPERTERLRRPDSGPTGPELLRPDEWQALKAVCG